MAQSDEKEGSAREDGHPPESSRTSERSGRQGDEKKDADKSDKDGSSEKEKEVKEEKRKPPSKKVIVIGIVVLLVLIVVAFFYWLHSRNFISTDDAYTTGHIHQISSRVSGTVIEVNVDDNQHVKQGDVIVRLDPRDYEVELQKARAGLAQAAAQGVRQEAVIAQMKAQVSVAEAQFEKARLDYERITSLYTKDIKAVSKADVDAATSSFNAARSNLEAAGANLQSAEAETGVDKANISASQAAADDAALQLSYCTVHAPVDGKISKKTVETGQRLQPGQELLAIVPDDVWILANLKENQLERVRVGQRVDIKIDTLPGYTFFGTVNSIQEGSGATFSLLPPDNATGNFTKIVQRVPVKIVFDENSIRDFRDRIVPGLSVEPTIDLQSLYNNKREQKRQNEEQKQNKKVESGE